MTGRGRQPKWLGDDRARFLIKQWESECLLSCAEVSLLLAYRCVTTFSITARGRPFKNNDVDARSRPYIALAAKLGASDFNAGGTGAYDAFK